MESNGAGKTALMIAPLWALTGSVDARAEGAASTARGVANADIVNEDSKAARVRVEGSVNGTPFVVERQVVRRWVGGWEGGGGGWWVVGGGGGGGSEIGRAHV